MLRRLIVLAIGLVLAGGTARAHAVEPQTDAANAAVQYIESLQNSDGGFPAFGSPSTPGSTLDAVFALIAAGVDPAEVMQNGNSPIDYLEAQAPTYAQDAGGAAKLGLALVLTDQDLYTFGGGVMDQAFRSNFNNETGQYGLDTFDQCLGILYDVRYERGLPSSTSDRAAQFLESLQAADSGWEFAEGQGSDSNTTAFALQALLATISRPGGPDVEAGLSYLHTTQNADGGFGFLPGAASDPNSTSVVIQALVAAGQGLGEHSGWSPGGHTPMEALLSFQNPETGAFQYGGVDSAYATYQAVPALLLAPFPDLETREVHEPTPQAPAVIEVTETATPVATVGRLPDAGGGANHGQTPWWAIGALAAGGATAIAAGVASRKSR